MHFKAIKEIEALFKYVSGNKYYIYVRKSSILEFGHLLRPQSCWDLGEN